MKTKIYLIRHTQTVGNIEHRLTGREEYEVTEKGKSYVSKMTERLKNVKFDIAYASTSKRTSETIQELADFNNLSIIEDEDLCEMYFGIYEGKTWDEINIINPKIDRLHQETNEICEIPEQETTEEVANRIYNEITKIVLENLGKTILICSHGVAIEAFIRKVKNQSFNEEVEKNSQKNTGINIITYEDGKFSVEVLNDISHLQGDLYEIR